ncbi:MAG: pre-peptidase C-terminal domain-containing protein [Caldilineaceae bacterium]
MNMLRFAPSRPLAVVSTLLVCLGLFAWAADTTLAAAPALRPLPPQGEALPDLIIARIQVSPPNPGPGTVGEITVTIKNIGAASATDFGIYLYVDPADQPPTLSTPETTCTFYGLGRLPPAPPGSSPAGHTFTQTAPQIYAWVDRNDQVLESNETNNLFPAPPPTAADPYEQDDTCATAQPIGVNAPPQEHNLFREDDLPDLDWVKLEATAGVIYVVSAIPVGADADLVLDSRTRCDRPGLGGGQTITITASANITYFIGAGHVNANYGPDNAYHLVVKSDERCTRYEPNNQCMIAHPIYPGGDAATSNLCMAGDEDWFTFEVQAGVRYTVTASNVGSKANVAMRLMEGCEGPTVEDGLNLSYTAAQQQLVQLRIKNQDAQAQGLETEYTVRVDADTTGRCEEDRYEQGAERDDVLAHAQPINIGGNAQEHNVCPAGDVDWVKFRAAAGASYTVETFDLGEKGDTRLCLHDPNGTELACDDDRGAGLGSRLLLTNTADSDYYLSIRDVNPRVAGPKARYRLHVLTEPCQADDYDAHDNVQAGATPLTPNGTPQTHLICGAADTDWVSFAATAHTPYVIETKNVGPDADTIVELYDTSGTLLARNDDYGDGIASQLNYTVTTAGNYFVKVRLYNPTRYGEGTHYNLQIRPGAGVPFQPSNEEASDELANEPTQEGARTLILVNENRLTTLYGAPATQQLLAKLDELARHDRVRGEIVKVNELAGVSDLYAVWENGWAPGQANAIADKIQRFIRRYRDQHAGLHYLLLVGDDRILPFYRLPDTTDKDPERSYSEVNTGHPTGVALRQNYFLTDDFYAATQTATPDGLTFFPPTLAVGRLIETPATMVAFIDRFLGNPTPRIDNVLVTGWDFVTDVAHDHCNRWRAILRDNSQTKVDCELIGEFWTQQQFRDKRLSINPLYAIQSINGHAAHCADQTPDGALVTTDHLFANTTTDFRSGLIYSLGCHGGLNVPPENVGPSTSKIGQFIALDLPELFLQKGANYVGNTGNGYGSDAGIELSERLVQLFTDELGRTTYGKALMTAKQRYFSQLVGPPTSYDQKILHELTFYGLPMFLPDFGTEVVSANTFADSFPGVAFDLSGFSFPGEGELTKRSVTVNFQNGQLEPVATGDGVYLRLSGQAQGTPGQPIQPLFYQELDVQNKSLRSILIQRAGYTTQTGVDPLVLTPTNEHLQADDELALDRTAGWLPPTPLRVQSGAPLPTFAMQLAQYNAATGQQRLFRTLQADLIYSSSADRTPPAVTIVDGLYDETTGQVTVKVGATDSAGVHTVILIYVQDEQRVEGEWQSLPLTFDPAARKWVGAIPGSASTRFFAQIVDRNGNKTDANNKGRWFAPVRAANAESMRSIFLPLISR